ncbi:redoxin domain-containing protein [Bacillus aerolatus]|uniref:Redoxin domain-containing protein n=1 Tax=Bacillus aerolatus TaxID=2653354 RepID=A0A6I1FKA4_9BACI|nr:redoxin domain-containing protein [Bacillus aerolatus]KAB7706491.1 redoxin domain-containing protein [Bacillus aerolatus]
MNKKWFGVLLLVLLVGIAAMNIMKDKKEITEIENPGLKVTDERIASGAVSGIGLGDKAPDFTLQTLDGKKVSLSDYEGKKVILNFWATWCPPCKAEMPHMQNFYKKEAEKSNVEILSVNLTSADKSKEAVAEFAKQYDLTFPIPLDVDGTIGEQYEVVTIPTSYILNTDRTVHQKIIGPMDEQMMHQLISELK